MDINIAVDFLRSQRKSRPKNERAVFDQHSAVTLIEQLIQDDRDIFFSVVTLKELLQFPYISCEEERINKVLPMFSTVIPVDERIGRIAALYSRESAEYREKHIEDCYIAATASAYRPGFAGTLADVQRTPEHGYAGYIKPHMTRTDPKA